MLLVQPYAPYCFFYYGIQLLRLYQTSTMHVSASNPENFKFLLNLKLF